MEVSNYTMNFTVHLISSVSSANKTYVKDNITEATMGYPTLAFVVTSFVLFIMGTLLGVSYYRYHKRIRGSSNKQKEYRRATNYFEKHRIGAPTTSSFSNYLPYYIAPANSEGSETIREFADQEHVLLHLQNCSDKAQQKKWSKAGWSPGNKTGSQKSCPNYDGQDEMDYLKKQVNKQDTTEPLL